MLSYYLFSKKTSLSSHFFSSHFLHHLLEFSLRLLAPRTQLRVGLATATSSLFLGETEAPTKRKKRRICKRFLLFFLKEKKTSWKNTKLKKNTLWKFVSKLKNEFDDVDDVDMKETAKRQHFFCQKNVLHFFLLAFLTFTACNFQNDMFNICFVGFFKVANILMFYTFCWEFPSFAEKLGVLRSSKLFHLFSWWKNILNKAKAMIFSRSLFCGSWQGLGVFWLRGQLLQR